MNLAPQSPTNDLMDRLEAMVSTLCGYSKDKEETAARKKALRHDIAAYTRSDTQQVDHWLWKRTYGPSYDKGIGLGKWLDEKMLGLSPKEKASFKGFLATVKKTRSES